MKLSKLSACIFFTVVMTTMTVVDTNATNKKISKRALTLSRPIRFIGIGSPHLHPNRVGLGGPNIQRKPPVKLDKPDKPRKLELQDPPDMPSRESEVFKHFSMLEWSHKLRKLGVIKE
ncbi:hypothetical protein BDF22DRAFT_665041 [Syncephalis plumigaleata]|nr:hypothetical protein BDF22DRAFT_665041 [Syncephalis plumigaleata]